MMSRFFTKIAEGRNALIQKSAQLRSEERGYILPLMLFMLLLFASVLFYLVDTGDVLLRKTRMQQAADSAALTQADWAARSLNIISMNNVAQTQLHTTRLVGASMYTYGLQTKAKSAYVLGQTAYESAQVAQFVSYWCPPSITAVATCPPAASAGSLYASAASAYTLAMAGFNAVLIAKDLKYKFKRGYDYSHAGFQTIKEMDDYLLDEKRGENFGRVSFDLARYHGAENLYTFGGNACEERKCEQGAEPLGIAVPANRGSYSSVSDAANAGSIAMQFCQAKESGTPGSGSRTGYAGYTGGRDGNNNARGYPTGVGPWKHSQNQDAYEFVNDKTRYAEFVGYLDFQWRYIPWPEFIGSVPLGVPTPVSVPIAQQKTWLKNWPPDGNNEQDMDSNAFLKMTERLDDLYCKTGGLAGELSSEVSGVLGQAGSAFGLLPDFFDISPKPVGLKGMENAAGQSGSLSSLLRHFTDSRFMSVFVVARRDGKRRLPDGDEKMSVYAYAQAQIYNPSANDLYSQNWRARLVPASFLNGRSCESMLNNSLTEDLMPPDPSEVLGDMSSNASKGYTQFISSLNGLECGDFKHVIVN